MGGRNSRPRPPRRGIGGPFRPPLFPFGPPDIGRIVMEEAIRAIIEDILRRIDQRQNGSLYQLSKTSNCCALPAAQIAQLSLKSYSNEAMSTEEMVLKLLNEIPPKYVDQLQNLEELVKRLNINVPPECMPEVAAALTKYYRQRHPAG